MNDEIPTGQWISIKDALPDLHEPVVFIGHWTDQFCFGSCDSTQYHHIWTDRAEQDRDGDYNTYTTSQVTHWLRLPPRPEE